MARSRPRGVEESAAGAAGAIYFGFRQFLHAFGVVGARLAVVVDESRPTPPNAHDAVVFAQRADGDRPDRRIETGDVPAPGENCDSPFASHTSKLRGEGTMTTVGIVGGLGPESTIDYYRRILEGWKRQDPSTSPSIVIDSLDVQRALQLVEHDRPALVEYLSASLRRL